MFSGESSAISTVAQGGVAVTALAFLHTALNNMIPYCICAAPLIALDFVYGIRAARKRHEKVTFSRAFRRTMSKTFDYLAWIIIAASIALAFEKHWLEWAILGMVMGNEIVSIIGNYLETKGLKFSWVGFYRWIIRAGSEKAGMAMEQAEAEEIISQDRDPKTGHFISNKQK